MSSQSHINSTSHRKPVGCEGSQQSVTKALQAVPHTASQSIMKVTNHE